MVERTAVNRDVVGSSPTRGALVEQKTSAYDYGPVVKRLRHRPFTAVTRVRFPSGSFFTKHGYHADVAQLAEQLICNQQVIGSSPIIGFSFIIINRRKDERLLGPLAQLVRATGS